MSKASNGEGGEKSPKGGTPKAAGRKKPSALTHSRLLQIGIVVLALVAGLIASVATSDEGDEASPEPALLAPKIVSVEELEEYAGSADHPVYWAGSLPGKEIELSTSMKGGVQVSYVEEGTKAGLGSAAVLTIGSYPLPDAMGALDAFAQRPTSIVRRSEEGREVVVGAEKPTSVYFADSAGNVQVEVYHPSYKQAMGIALSDRVRPVG